MKRPVYNSSKAPLLSCWSWFSKECLKSEQTGVTEEMYVFFGGATAATTALRAALDQAGIEGVKIALANLETEVDAFDMLLQDEQKGRGP